MAASSSKAEQVVQKEGDVLHSISKKKYKLGTLLASGHFGDVFKSLDGVEEVAVKTVKGAFILDREVEVLNITNSKQLEHFLKLIDHGPGETNVSFMVLTLLGKDLYVHRRETPNKKFKRGTGLRIGLQTLEAIRQLHSLGYINRDIKPHNFAPGIGDQKMTIVMFDFGMARKYEDENGEHLEEEEKESFHGTPRYASLASHNHKDVSRRDDMESWFYLLVEVVKGGVPWRSTKDKEELRTWKTAMRDHEKNQLTEGLPHRFSEMFLRIVNLGFKDEPDYGDYQEILEKACKDHLVSKKAPWEWDDPSKYSLLAPPVDQQDGPSLPGSAVGSDHKEDK